MRFPKAAETKIQRKSQPLLLVHPLLVLQIPTSTKRYSGITTVRKLEKLHTHMCLLLEFPEKFSIQCLSMKAKRFAWMVNEETDLGNFLSNLFTHRVVVKEKCNFYLQSQFNTERKVLLSYIWSSTLSNKSRNPGFLTLNLYVIQFFWDSVSFPSSLNASMLIRCK